MPSAQRNAEYLNLEPSQVAEIIVIRSSSSARGSGYLVSPGRVLTAAHVVSGAMQIRVRFDADSPAEWSSSARPLVLAADLAVLELLDETADRRAVVPPIFAALPDKGAMIRVHTMGFPIFKLRRDEASYAEGTFFRDSHHAVGWSSILSGRREGTLEISLPAAGFAHGATSPWEGMSGAAVWHEDRLIGVVSYHDSAEGQSRLTATRIDRVLTQLDDDRRRAVEDAIGIRGRLTEIDLAAAPAGEFLTQAMEFSPSGGLVGREDELAEIASFCIGDEDYLWLKGDPWAGKSALLATFALNPPQQCAVVSYFVSRRVNGRSDSAAFSDALLAQLSEMVGLPLPTQVDTLEKDAWRRRLIERAVEYVQTRGRMLLLVVDGLDEDNLGDGIRPLPSIASVLPKRPPSGLKVVVSSRIHPPLPRDVPADHPLRSCRVLEISGSPVAQDMRDAAILEIDTVLSSDATGQAVLCLLAAARGGLSLEDLSSLTGSPTYQVDATLRGSLGRSLTDHQPNVRVSDALPAYVFAHETLQELALSRAGRDLIDRAQSHIFSWISRYAAGGWSDDTPQFAATGYFELLKRRGNAEAILEAATDPKRHLFLRRLFGGDQAALAEVEAAQEITGRQPGNADSLVRLAFHRERLNSLDSHVPPQLPALFERLDMTARAWWAVRSMPSAVARDEALALLAVALARKPDPDRAEQVVSSIEGGRRRQEAAISLCGVYSADPVLGKRLINLIDLVESPELRLTVLAQLFQQTAGTITVPEVLSLAARVAAPDRVPDALMCAVGALAGKDRIAEARILIAELDSRQRKLRAELLVARRLLEFGRRDEALAMLDAVKDESAELTVSQADPINVDLVSLYGLSDQHEEALASMSRVEDLRKRDEAIADYACLLAAGGDAVQAEEMIGRITSGEDLVRASLDLISVVQAANRTMAARVAERVLESVLELPERHMSLGAELTAVLAAAGLPDLVERMLSELGLHGSNYYAVAARAAHRARRPDDALLYLELIEDVGARILALIAVAQQSVREMDFVQAAVLSGHAEILATDVGIPGVASETLAAVGAILLDCGDTESARLKALQSEELSRRHLPGTAFAALPGELAVEFVARGDWARGLELLAHVPAGMHGRDSGRVLREAIASSDETMKRSMLVAFSSDRLADIEDTGQRVLAAAALVRLSDQLGERESAERLRREVADEMMALPRVVDQFTWWLPLSLLSDDLALSLLAPLKPSLSELPNGALRLGVLRALVRLGEADLALAMVPQGVDEWSVRSLAALVLSGSPPDGVPQVFLEQLSASRSRLSSAALVDGLAALLHCGELVEARRLVLGAEPSRERSEMLIELVCAFFVRGLIDNGKEAMKDALRPHEVLETTEAWIEVGRVLARAGHTSSARIALVEADARLVGQPTSVLAVTGRAAKAAVFLKAGLVRECRAELARAESVALVLDEPDGRSAAAHIGAVWAGLGLWSELERMLVNIRADGDLSTLHSIVSRANALEYGSTASDRAAFLRTLSSCLVGLPLSAVLPLLYVAPTEVLNSLAEEVITLGLQGAL